MVTNKEAKDAIKILNHYVMKDIVQMNMVTWNV